MTLLPNVKRSSWEIKLVYVTDWNYVILTIICTCMYIIAAKITHFDLKQFFKIIQWTFRIVSTCKLFDFIPCANLHTEKINISI